MTVAMGVCQSVFEAGLIKKTWKKWGT